MTEAQKDALEAELSSLSDAEVARRLNAAEVESEEFEIIVGECHRRDIDV